MRAIRGVRPAGIHPFLFAAAFVLQVALAGEIAPTGFIRPLLVAELAVGLVLLVSALAFRSVAAGALFTSLVGVTVASYAPFTMVLYAARDVFGMAGVYVLASALMALAIFAVVLVTHGGLRGSFRSHLPEATRYLDLFAILFLIVVLLPAIPQMPGWVAAPRAQAAATLGPLRSDVYLLLLDGYPRADELVRHFDFDNADFLSALETRGFSVDSDSHSNYPTTDLTLTSMLTMDYIGSGKVVTSTESEIRRLLREAVLNGAGMQAIRAAGFQVVATAPGWEHVSLRAGADRYIDRPEITDVERAVLWNTWLPDTPLMPAGLYATELHKRVVGILDDAARMAGENRDTPVFAFVHVPAPHLPLTFDASGGPYATANRGYDGGRKSVVRADDTQYERAFVASLQALNQRVIQAVDTVRASARTPPVIVIMSDHGYFATTPDVPDGTLRNLFASYTPSSPGLLTDAPTPVNLLRYLTAPPGHRPVEIKDRYFSRQLEDGKVTLSELDRQGG